MSKFLKELKRRNVIKSTIAYLVVAWVLLQVFTLLLPIIGAPEWIVQGITLVLAIGLPIWIIVSWVYDITPQGIEKTNDVGQNDLSSHATNKRLNAFIIASLSIAVVVLGLKISGVFSSNSNNEYAIAVLPFVNMSDDAEQEYFSDGISEEIINMLAQVPKLTVMARTSSFAFKGKNMDLKLIGEQLNVGYLLEGSVRRSGNTLRITAQLIDVATGAHLYSEKFDREVEDVFDIQDEISQNILSAVKIKLLGEEKEAVFKKYTDNTDAYELYLEALFHVNKFTPDGFLKAIELFDKAIAIDPNYAIAYSGKAFSYMNLRDFDWLPSDESKSQAIEAAEKSLELDNQIADGHLAVGRIKLHWDWNVRDANAAFKKALDINPNSAEIHVQLAFCLVLYGRHEEAIKHAEIAKSLDPLSILNLVYTNFIYYFVLDSKSLLANGEKMVALEPNFFSGHYWIGTAYTLLEKFDEAIPELELSVRQNPGPLTLNNLGFAYAEMGDTLKVREVIKKIEAIEGIEEGGSYYLGSLYALIGELDTAYYYFEKAVQNRENAMVFLKQQFSLISPEIENDPRMAKLLDKMNVIY